jgi:uncharacterized protein (DUF952 family)
VIRIPKVFLVCLLIALSIVSSYDLRSDERLLVEQQMEKSQTPKYLYKVLKVRDWKESQRKGIVQLANDDKSFVHLATGDQVSRIVGKFWINIPEYVILKIDTSRLKGRLVFEANPDGTNKYYHLYDGSIPLDAVIHAKEIVTSRDR